MPYQSDFVAYYSQVTKFLADMNALRNNVIHYSIEQTLTTSVLSNKITIRR
jgi:hypothetical protein